MTHIDPVMSFRLIQKARRNIVYYLVSGAFAFFNVIPRSLALFFGGVLGILAWMALPKDRHRIDRHLRLIYKDRFTASQRFGIGQNFFANSGRNLADVMRFRRHFTQEIAPFISVEGLEHFDSAYKAGKGLIGITGHIGNFELLAVYLASLGYEIAVIGREMYDPRLNKLLVDNRQAMGLTNIGTTESPKRFLKWLHEGKVIGVLIDTDSMRVRSKLVPFLGRLSNTPVSPIMLGLKSNAAFVPAVCVRGGDNRYSVIIKPAIQYETTGDFETDVENVTLLCNNVLGEIVSQFPDQWIWLHNRWHTAPQ